MVRALIFSLLAISLSGCTPVTRDRIITVRVTAYVPIPAELVAHGTAPRPKDDTCGSAIEVARERRDLLTVLMAQLDQIGTIQGTKIGEADCPSLGPSVPTR